MMHISLEGSKYSFTKCEDTIHVYSMTRLRWNMRTCQASFTGSECLECVLLLSRPIQRPKYLTLLHSILLSRKKTPSFQTRTAFLSKTESRHTLLSLATSLMFNRPQLSAYGIISHLHPFYLKNFIVHLQGGCLDLSYLLKGTMVTFIQWPVI